MNFQRSAAVAGSGQHRRHRRGGCVVLLHDFSAGSDLDLAAESHGEPRPRPTGRQCLQRPFCPLLSPAGASAKLRPGFGTGTSCYCRRSDQAEGKQVTFRADAASPSPRSKAMEERAWTRDSHPGEQEPAGDRDILFRRAGRTPSAVRYKSFRYQAGAGRRQGELSLPSPGRTIPARRICRDEHELAEPLGRAVL